MDFPGGGLTVKVIGVGLPKTGTTTLGMALKVLGYSQHISWTEEVNNLYKGRRIEELINMAQNFDSFEDYPWCMIYQELDKAFPNSKFIATKRQSVDIWIESRRKHSFFVDKVFFSEHDSAYYKEQHDLYLRHYSGLRDYFSSRPNDYIELCWETGDGWQQLTRFLGLPVPIVEFPHLRKSQPW